MPERLSRVTVKTTTRAVVIPWATRDALIEHIRDINSARGAIRAFEAAHASRPVELSTDQQFLLRDVIETWSKDAGADNLPDGLWELRHALSDEIALGGE
jgi:hypothetical protein